MSAGDPGSRVAELIVEPVDGGPGRRGSGYRVSAELVLTAAHVVDGTRTIQVRFDADQDDEWVAQGTVLLVSSVGDVAVIGIAARPGEQPIEPARFGRISPQDAVLACTATGFPRFKLRDDHSRRLPDGDPSQYRDSCHLVGTAPLLSNRREGTLEICLDGPPPAPDPDPARSPWEGMSGAAVFSHGLIVGVVSEHHRSDGLGRLAATRCDTWSTLLAAADVRKLRELLGPVADASELPDAVPPSRGALVDAAYTAQVRSLAPLEPLRDRDEELAELLAFCAGDEPYQWWQAPPWAGKTALTSTFVLNPPAGVRIAAFFVTSRLSGEADADAFLQAMIDHLGTLAGEPAVAVAGMAARRGRYLHLLETAARRLRDRGQRLVLVVDGLDEDQGVQPSIAYLLPRPVPDGVRVLVTSRFGPGVPGDVPGDHPLRHCPRRRLAPSPYARHLEIEAKNELVEQLRKGALGEEIAGVITASGGGLTFRDICELTGRPGHSVEAHLNTVIGRSLRLRDRQDRGQAYLFAHETLRVIAEETLGNDLGPYRERIHAWADRYRLARWPDGTPFYLLRPYARLLLDEGQAERLVSLAADTERHELMLRRTRSDLAALGEITSAQDLLLGQQAPDLTALVRLTLERDRIGRRGAAVPAELPAVWARLGHVDLAESLARSQSGASRATVLSSVAAALAETDPDRAADLIEESLHVAAGLAEPEKRVTAWSTIIAPLARLDPARAHALSIHAEAEPPYQADERPWMMRDLVMGLIDGSMSERAEQVARSIADRWHQAEALAAIAESLAVTAPAESVRLAEAAWQCMSAIEDPWEATSAWGEIAKALAGTAPERATRAAEAARLAAAETEAQRSSSASRWAVGALAAARMFDEAEHASKAITKMPDRMGALTAIIDEMVSAGLSERAHQIVTLTEPSERDRLGSALARALATAGRFEEAQQTAATVSDPDRRASAYTGIAAALLEARPARVTEANAAAEEALRASQGTPVRALHRCEVLGAVVDAFADSEPDRARIAARAILDVTKNMNEPDFGIQMAARALASAGLLAEAALAIDRLEKHVIRTDAHRDLLQECARQRRFDLAAQAARALPHGVYGTAEAWDVIADLRHHDAERGVRAVADVIGSLTRANAGARHESCEAGAAVVHELLAAGVLDRPERLIEAFARRFFVETDPWSALAEGLAEAFPAVAMAAAREGLRITRDRTDSPVPYPELHATALSRMAMALIRIDPVLAAHEAREAWRMASGITARSDWDLTLRDISLALAATRLFEEADHAVRAIGDPSYQVAARSDIAVQAAHSGPDQVGRAVRIAAGLLTEDEWFRALPALAVLEPDAVRIVHEAFAPARTDSSGTTG